MKVLDYAEIRQCLKQLRNTPDVTHNHLLLNGMTAGDFCLHYLLSKSGSSNKTGDEDCNKRKRTSSSSFNTPTTLQKTESKRVAIIDTMTLAEERACLKEIRNQYDNIQATTILNNHMSAGQFAFLYILTHNLRRQRNYKRRKENPP